MNFLFLVDVSAKNSIMTEKIDIGCNREVMVALHPDRRQVVICCFHTESEMENSQNSRAYTTICITKHGVDTLCYNDRSIRKWLIEMVMGVDLSEMTLWVGEDVIMAIESETYRVSFQRRQRSHDDKKTTITTTTIDLKPAEMEKLLEFVSTCRQKMSYY